MVAGSPRAARSVPAGSRRRNGAQPTSTPTAARPRPRSTLCAPSAAEHEGGTGRGAHGVGDPVLVARWRRVGPAEADEGRHGDGPGHDDQRDQAEEHPAPPEQVGDRRPRRAGPTIAGDDPGGRQHRHHPGPLHLVEAAADGDVGDGRHGARAEPLQAASDDEHPHGRGEARHEEAGREQHEARHVGPRRPVPVGVAAGQDDPDQAGQFEAREDPPVERQARRGRGPRPASR